ncbi:hypothetical protein CDL15_Pgr014796 [Punica granatum]|uniref:Serine/threonine-protein kinase ATM n=1 Tax=Punica granatum TaxID=22663 RepID=A0A218XZR0_PUNGR|nr:hypothetical protein CDL15_Pgr014796 [Punica granatum]
MAAAVTSRDVQEIVSKLSSDKAKPREEGIRLLNTWLDGERSIAFCNYLAHNTAQLKPNEIPHSETWPFLVTLLIQCASLEVSASKRRSPKLLYAKTLRVVVQRAEDSKFSGCTLPLLSVVKLLFNHIWDISSNVPSFQSEYGLILRHLLTIKDYRFHMRRKIYSSLMLWYMEKVETSLNEKITSLSNPKEEVFRCILTLHSLLENPPGDFPENLREGIVEGFVGIFSAVRDEGKISRKLIECVNMYLLQDGPNLGCLSWKIHESLQQFVFRYWLTSHDRSLKDAFTTYARLQLNLERDIGGESSLMDQLVDVVCKELDQISMSSSGNPRNEVVKDDKVGSLSGAHCNLVELGALVFYKSCRHIIKAPVAGKRARREHAAVHLKEALMKGKWLWGMVVSRGGYDIGYVEASGKFSGSRAYQGSKGSCGPGMFHGNVGVSRGCWIFGIMNDANVEHSYDGLFWTLRSLQELCSVLPLADLTKEVDVALMLLGDIIARDLVSTCIVPEDVWGLQLFNQLPSLSVLYFISIYFSRKGSQGDLRDMLHLRKSLLQAVLGHLRWQESSIFSERIVLLFPAAVYALCAGHAPFECKLKDISSSSLLNVAEAFDGRFKGEDDPKIFDCSVEALARINSCSGDEVYLVNCCRGVRLPRQLRDQLLHDMEIYIQGALVQDEIKCRPLQDVIYVCALYANLIYGSVLTRQKEEVSPFLSKMVIALLELLDCATALIEETQNSFHSQGCLGPVSLCDGTSSILSSFRIFVSSPIFTELRNEKALDAISYCVMKQSMERLLRAIIGLYEGNICKRSPQPDMDFSAAEMPESVRPIPDNISRIMDMELDVDADFKDADIFSVGGKVTSGLAFSMEKWKLGMVHENMLHHICQQPCWSSSENVSRVVEMIDDMMKEQIDLKLDCHCLISDIRSFIGAFLSSEKNAKKERQHFLSLRKEEFDQDFTQLGELVMKVAEVDLLDWSGRVKLVDSICDFILLCPKVGQMLIERLLLMLRDSDYRVRVCVARRIGVLFQTWEGHMEMFQDICSNFGFPLVCCLKGKVIVSAREVLAAAPQPRQIMETVIATLMHIALHSEIIEMEALFMVCVISAIDPCQRELVSIVLDSISKELQYACRSKYLEEVLGSMIFNWVACNVNLAALVEIRRIFVSDAEPSYFMQYCWQWLLPALILHDESHNQLSWLAQSVLHYTALGELGQKKEGKLFNFAEISETERDKLIRKHMVSIVSHVLSLVSNTSEPTIPFFPMDTIVRAIQTVVDGFLDMGEYRTGAGVIDKINIFRPDRVFMFIVEIHHKITAAVHHRHKCHRLAGMEVLVEILGHRTAVVSTLNLQALHKKFLAAVSFQREWENGAWHEDQEVVQAVWTLVRICASDDADGVRMLVSDFISRVGIGDPHCVVFHLPEGSSGIHVCEHVNSESASEVNFTLNTSISDELLVALLKLLKKYLMDDSVVIVDMTSQVLRIHSRGVNMEVVEKLLSELEQKFKAEAMPLEKSSTWETHGKTFEAWICPLAFSLIGHCNDVILRLCQDIVLLKADVCELLLPSIMVDLARRKDLDRNLHRSISSQVQEHIFVETNNLIKSVQLAKPSSYGSRTRSASTKNIDHHANSLPSAVSTSSWEKVYWLYIDYLVVAKSALVCGSYFTSVMYVEYWCEENFDNLTLGTPDFSPQEVLRPHVEILVSAVTQINEPDSLYGIIQTHNLTSQIVTFEHEANWSKALEYYDLQVRSEAMVPLENGSRSLIAGHSETSFSSCSPTNDAVRLGKPYKGLIRSLQQIGCTHVLDLYCQGLTSRKGQFEYDLEFAELQYEAAWRAGNWDFSLLSGSSASSSSQLIRSDHFNESLHCCLRALREGDLDEFLGKLKRSKQELVLSVSHASEESTEYIYSTIIKLQGARFSLATAALHDLKYLAAGDREHSLTSYWLGRLEEAKLLRAQGQNEMAISLANYISQNSTLSRTILESYLKPAVALAEDQRRTHKGFIERQNQTHFHLAHYADALFKSYEDRLTSNEWQAAMRLRKHKTLELEALIRRLKSSTKASSFRSIISDGEKTDYSVKILELQRQLAMDKEEAERLQDDRDNFLSLALEGYKRCLVIGDKYDVRVVQSYKFVPLAYQIASRMGGSKEGHRKNNFQFALVSLLKKMSIDHPYHSIFQLLALANGDRIKDKQRSKSSFIVDMDKKLAAENLLKELYSYHGDIISQMKQMVEVYIKLAELEIRREDTSKTMKLPRDIRSVQQLELVVPVVTATIPVDRSCQYREGTFPHFKGLEDSIMVMNGVNAPKVVECLGSDGQKYRQLAKSGNDDLRQDANHQDTRRRRLGVRTYKVVPFTPSAGVLEWVNGTVPLGDYLIGSNRNGGAHARYGKGDWTFPKCREHMSNAKDKRKAFQEVCENFRPVMHNFFLERFLLPSDWFEKRLAYTRSVATSSMVGYIVGLGDRHSMNILVDQATAEVVHIDLGVAFEQGLMLKTPERVPFRLTRDLIDGMGVTGVEGVFRRCCEETLSVMRTNKEALLTIVEETDDDLEMCFEGSREETEGNKDAARALMRVKQKLDGYEGGEMRSLHGQVQQLIQDAIDPERLCQMFPGWGAWL